MIYGEVCFRISELADSGRYFGRVNPTDELLKYGSISLSLDELLGFA